MRVVVLFANNTNATPKEVLRDFQAQGEQGDSGGLALSSSCGRGAKLVQRRSDGGPNIARVALRVRRDASFLRGAVLSRRARARPVVHAAFPRLRERGTHRREARVEGILLELVKLLAHLFAFAREICARAEPGRGGDEALSRRAERSDAGGHARAVPAPSLACDGARAIEA